MSLAVLADTGPLYAAIDPSDQYDERARAEVQRLDEAGYAVLVAFPRLLETYTLILHRLGLARRGPTRACRRGPEGSRSLGWRSPGAVNQIAAWVQGERRRAQGGTSVSQERIRFPIQPADRRRSAKSSEDVVRAPEDVPGHAPEEAEAIPDAPRKDQDKPDYPPHERHLHDRHEHGHGRGGHRQGR